MARTRRSVILAEAQVHATLALSAPAEKGPPGPGQSATSSDAATQGEDPDGSERADDFDPQPHKIHPEEMVGPLKVPVGPGLPAVSPGHSAADQAKILTQTIRPDEPASPAPPAPTRRPAGLEPAAPRGRLRAGQPGEQEPGDPGEEQPDDPGDPEPGGPGKQEPGGPKPSSGGGPVPAQPGGWPSSP